MDDYDHETLDTAGKTRCKVVRVQPDEYRKLIAAMKRKISSDLFGKEKDPGLESLVMQIYQSYGGKGATR